MLCQIPLSVILSAFGSLKKKFFAISHVLKTNCNAFRHVLIIIIYIAEFGLLSNVWAFYVHLFLFLCSFTLDSNLKGNVFQWTNLMGLMHSGLEILELHLSYFRALISLNYGLQSWLCSAFVHQQPMHSLLIPCCHICITHGIANG